MGDLFEDYDKPAEPRARIANPRHRRTVTSWKHARP